MADKEQVVRKNEDGGILVWQVWDRISGAPVKVDDRTYNPEWHSDEDPNAAKE